MNVFCYAQRWTSEGKAAVVATAEIHLYCAPLSLHYGTTTLPLLGHLLHWPVSARYIVKVGFNLLEKRDESLSTVHGEATVNMDTLPCTQCVTRTPLSMIIHLQPFYLYISCVGNQRPGLQDVCRQEPHCYPMPAPHLNLPLHVRRVGQNTRRNCMHASMHRSNPADLVCPPTFF